MRERIYRGKELEGDRWVFGSLLVGAQSCFICWEEGLNNFETYKVNPLTVGVSAGYVDIFGVALFEGDIIESGHGFEYLLILQRNGVRARSKTGFLFDLEDIYHPVKIQSIHDRKKEF